MTDKELFEKLSYKQKSVYENLTDKALKKKIQRIDKNRARTRFLIVDGEWGHRKSYHLIVNTTDWKDLDELASSIAEMIKRWAKQ